MSDALEALIVGGIIAGGAYWYLNREGSEEVEEIAAPVSTPSSSRGGISWDAQPLLNLGLDHLINALGNNNRNDRSQDPKEAIVNSGNSTNTGGSSAWGEFASAILSGVGGFGGGQNAPVEAPQPTPTPISYVAPVLRPRGGLATVKMDNQLATRNRPITGNLMQKLASAAGAVYGHGTQVVVYSGGQDRKGHGSRRVGNTIRHDDYGQGGRAADCYVYVNGQKQSGVALARLGQYWLASGYGAVGLEMKAGGIHLDEWTTPPPGGGMYWTYRYSDGKSWGRTVKSMLAAGAAGRMPEVTA